VIEESGGEVVRAALPTVMGNPQLIFLFQNLIGNALKYRDYDRPLRVEVGALQEDDGWRFWVRDNGIGIEARFVEDADLKIFKLGERLHGPSSKYKGTGYGLSICKHIVARHGGRIWVESEFGRGSTFFFTLPADPGAKRALTSATPTAPAAEP
jgi:signal transduction histidine kinase